jgi:hypothetical protein
MEPAANRAGDPHDPQQPRLTAWDGACRQAEGFCEAVAQSQDAQSAPQHPHHQITVGLDLPLAAEPGGCGRIQCGARILNQP